jgi:hypothetical protein
MLYIPVLCLVTDLGEIRYGRFRRKTVENLDEFRYTMCNESYIFVVSEFSENSEVKGIFRGVREFISVLDTIFRFG